MSKRYTIGALILVGALAGLAAGFWLLRGSFASSLVEPAAAIDFLVDHDDIYAVSAADLRRFGWQEVDPENLRLEHGGEPYPFYLTVDGSDYRIVFYGRLPDYPDRRYTPHNVYRLFRDGTEEGTVRYDGLSEPENGEHEVERSIQTTLLLEGNELYVPGLLETRPWFWKQLAAPGMIPISFDLSAYNGGEAAITVAVVASTESGEADPDHHLRFTLNGMQAADLAWDGAGERTIEFQALAGVLRTTGNALEIEAVADTGVPADIVLLDWVQIEFPRAAVLDGGPLLFTAFGEWTGFMGFGDSPALIFDLGSESAAPDMHLIEREGAASFATVPGEAYAAGALDDLPAPAGFRAVEDFSDLRSAGGAEYLAIGDPALLEPLVSLLAHREAQGLRTLAVPLQAVYDQFAAGLSTPEGIRSFLAYAVENWEIKPRYILLVGDWSYDPYGYVSEVPEYGLPSFFVFTEYGGETVSDVAFALLDGDELPDVALGRFPARTPQQVETLVAKTLAFENMAAGEWSRRVLAVADGTEGRFSGDGAAFMDGFGAGYETVPVDPSGGGRAVAQRIEDELDRGALIFSYFGHGSLTQFGKEGLFTIADAEALENGEQTPILVSITCLAGMFTHPAVDSLTEAMLWNEGGGAVAGLSATSLTLPEFQSFLSAALVEAIVADPGGRLGDGLLAAQRRMPLELGPAAKEVLLTFLLFGDPAIVLPSVPSVKAAEGLKINGFSAPDIEPFRGRERLYLLTSTKQTEERKRL